jgi:hypothetical protein
LSSLRHEDLHLSEEIIDESRSSEEMGDERHEEERSVMVGSGSSNRSCSCVRLHVDQRLGNSGLMTVDQAMRGTQRQNGGIMYD